MQNTWFVRFLIRESSYESFWQQNYEDGLERRLTLGLADADSSSMDNLQRGRLWSTNFLTSYGSESFPRTGKIPALGKLINISTGLLCCGVQGPSDWGEVTYSIVYLIV